MKIEHQIVAFNQDTGQVVVRYRDADAPGVFYDVAIDVPFTPALDYDLADLDALIEAFAPRRELMRRTVLREGGPTNTAALLARVQAPKVVREVPCPECDKKRQKQ